MIPPEISVITIVKNNATDLPRAIDSVLTQTFGQFEYLIVNDGSTDQTAAIVDAYAAKDSRLIPQHLLVNAGRAKARSLGMEKSKGRYVFFLDSDDYLPENSLNDLYRTAEMWNSDIVFGHIKSFDNLSGAWRPRYYTDNILTSERHNFCLLDHLNLVDNHQIVGTLYRSDFLEENKITFSNIRENAEDVIFSFFSLYFAKRISMLPQNTVYYYSVGMQQARVNERKIFDARDNVIQTIDFASRNGSPQLKKRMLQKGILFCGGLDRVQHLYGEDTKKIKSYIRSLAPFSSQVSEDCLMDLPLGHYHLPANEVERLTSYFIFFIRALQSEKIDLAYYLWSQKHNLDLSRVEISRLSDENQMLHLNLQGIYKSKSWRFMLLFRDLFRKFLRKQTQ